MIFIFSNVNWGAKLQNFTELTLEMVRIYFNFDNLEKPSNESLVILPDLVEFY
jgi:hypothetical protein